MVISMLFIELDILLGLGCRLVYRFLNKCIYLIVVKPQYIAIVLILTNQQIGPTDALSPHKLIMPRYEI